ncbi:MAG TPA: OmpA family protein [Polyangia bacterium]|jgi:outer membrane protein OmpA-like peptidoglycan-associated protein
MHLAAALLAFELAASGPVPGVPLGDQVSPAPANAQAEGTPEIAEQIFFDDGAAQIKQTSLPVVDAVAAELKGRPEAFPLVALDGHAAPNERGPMRLSLSRATAVRLALIARGVDGARLLERVSGATMPPCDHNRDVCWERERRVEFAVLHPATPPAPPPSPPKAPAGEGEPVPERPAAESAKQSNLLEQVTFARGSSVLAPSALAPLDLVAGFLKANPTSLKIDGYAAAGEHGSTELARARAEAVRAYLVACGVSADALTVRSRGTEEPVCRERTRECRARNRRTELRFSDARP